MAGRLNGIIERWRWKRCLQQWAGYENDAAQLDLSSLRDLRSRSRQMRHATDRVLHVADGRLALPRIGTNAMQKPLHCDWAYRPQLWRGPLAVPGLCGLRSGAKFGDEISVFHDCSLREIALRQLRNSRENDLAPFGLRMEVFGFSGAFLSLALGLPPSASKDLKRNHVLRLTTDLEIEKPIAISARLNIKHGPNTEQMVRELPVGDDAPMVEFDIAYSDLNEKRVDRVWVDLIFENPVMNQIVLRDLTFTRRPRADI